MYPRLEIREFQKRSIEWNLFLLSLNRLQSVPQSDKLSYYQIAGMYRNLSHYASTAWILKVLES